MTTENPKSSNKSLALIVVGLFVVIGLAYFFSLGANEKNTTDQIAQTESEEFETEDGEIVTFDDEDTTATDVNAAAFDLASAKRERILGDTSAPIKISEHSSFSCGHCGKFHQETFDQFKTNYIDTGKAYLVFSDFPLNRPALQASMSARCIKDDQQYFEYVKDLFATQNDWAFETNYLELLEAKAGNFGISKELFKECVNNEELQTALANTVKASQAQHKIASTPSFVVNNQKTLTGAMAYADFDEAIQNAIKEIEGTNATNNDTPVLEAVPELESVNETE